MNTSKQSGFSLIELIVVIAIIGILSAIVYASFGDARASARDEVRKTTLKEMQLAIELYKAQNGRYPAGCRGENTWSGNLGTSWQCSGNSNNYIVGLVPDFIASLPTDPRSGNSSGIGYTYFVETNGTGYKLLAHSAAEINLTDYNDEFARCPAPNGSIACPNENSGSSYNAFRRHYAVYSEVSRNR